MTSQNRPETITELAKRIRDTVPPEEWNKPGTSMDPIQALAIAWLVLDRLSAEETKPSNMRQASVILRRLLVEFDYLEDD